MSRPWGAGAADHGSGSKGPWHAAPVAFLSRLAARPWLSNNGRAESKGLRHPISPDGWPFSKTEESLEPSHCPNCRDGAVGLKVKKFRCNADSTGGSKHETDTSLDRPGRRMRRSGLG
jgi:hypothetical protein